MMEKTIQIPDNLPEEFVERKLRALEDKLRRESGQIPENLLRVSFVKGIRRLGDDVRNETPILRKIKKLVEVGDVAAAREMLSSLPETTSHELENWRRNLAIPEPRLNQKATGKSNRQKDFNWLQENADAHRGKWVALADGNLLGSCESQLELYHDLKRKGQTSDAMFVKIETQR